ncbi:ABC transporter ATP-binding protein [Kitasatospora sp. MAP5-34]|uniref:ABC transporter ATP-binding protein n=1 Tax=Kitasatospora sp. MAP5-34 TaxID=3035102 RepID=UPI00247363E6|nr:ABC transporter ATP-binding protein [Kitasatospora sp. MAP5-34]MDH6576143.1 ABC-2 type transport system ATP-binding protein [Kitasatospora sp. MAP5-34]
MSHHIPAQADDTPALEAVGLGLKYRRNWALRDCDFRLPAGRICGLVGPNGAGKSTLMSLAAHLLTPSAGTISVFGGAPGTPETRRRIAFLGQDKPLYPRLTVAETLRAGYELNPGWDQAAAVRIVEHGNLSMSARVGGLTGGQRTRVALALALGKRPDLLMLDEPLSDVDPVSRQELTGLLMAEAVENGTTVLISSHVLAELDGVCDYVLVLGDGRVRLAGDVDELLDAHRRIVGAHEGAGPVPELDRHQVVELRRTGRQVTALVRPSAESADIDSAWDVAEPTLEELLLSYLRSPEAPALLTPGARPARVPAAAR